MARRIAGKRKVGTCLKGQRGASAVFFAVVVLPLLFFVLTLALDLSLFFTSMQRAQALADESAMYAYRFMPDSAAARSAGEGYASRFAGARGLKFEQVSVSVDDDLLSVSLNGTSPLNAARWFGFDTGLPLQALSSARTVPLDVFITVDVSARLAPNGVSGSPWGNEVMWPAATFFAEDMQLSVPHPANEAETIELDARLLTQQCFNPVLSREKEAAISAYSYFSKYALNSIGVGFYPGQINALDVVRSVEKGGIRSRDGEMIGEADFDAVSGTLTSSNLMCAATAFRERAHDEYRFAPTPQIDPVYFDGTLHYESGYQSVARAAEVIWSRSVSDRNFYSTGSLILEGANMLDSARSRIERGGLIDRSAKVLVMFMSDLPGEGTERFPAASAVNSLSASLMALRNRVLNNSEDIRVYMIIFGYEQWPPYQTEEIESLRELISHYEVNEQAKRLKLRVLFTQNPDELQRKLTDLLVLDEKTALISK